MAVVSRIDVVLLHTKSHYSFGDSQQLCRFGHVSPCGFQSLQHEFPFQVVQAFLKSSVDLGVG